MDVAMNPRFDIFIGTPAHPLWLESAYGLDEAVSRMEQQARENPGHYFVFDANHQNIVASIDPGNPKANFESA